MMPSIHSLGGVLGLIRTVSHMRTSCNVAPVQTRTHINRVIPMMVLLLLPDFRNAGSCLTQIIRFSHKLHYRVLSSSDTTDSRHIRPVPKTRCLCIWYPVNTQGEPGLQRVAVVSKFLNQTSKKEQETFTR